MEPLDQTLLLAGLREPAAAALALAMYLPTAAVERAAETVGGVLALLRRHGRRRLHLATDALADTRTADETAILRLFDAIAARDDRLAVLLLQWLVRPAGQAALASLAARLVHVRPGLAN